MKKDEKQTYSTTPQFKVWPPEMYRQLHQDDISDPITISEFFFLFLIRRFIHFREFLVESMMSMGSKIEVYKTKDIPPFMHQLIEEVEMIQMKQKGVKDDKPE